MERPHAGAQTQNLPVTNAPLYLTIPADRNNIDVDESRRPTE